MSRSASEPCRFFGGQDKKGLPGLDRNKLQAIVIRSKSECVVATSFCITLQRRRDFTVSLTLAAVAGLGRARNLRSGAGVSQVLAFKSQLAT